MACRKISTQKYTPKAIIFAVTVLYDLLRRIKNTDTDTAIKKAITPWVFQSSGSAANAVDGNNSNNVNRNSDVTIRIKLSLKRKTL